MGSQANDASGSPRRSPGRLHAGTQVTKEAGAVSSARAAMGRQFTNLPREHGFEPMAIEGTIPPGLEGTFVRNGPAVFELFGRTYQHWFDADGAVTAVRFSGGRAEGACRITETPGLRKERVRGRVLYGSLYTRGPSWWRSVGGRMKNPANIHVLSWQGRLFALPESNVPIEIDPATLETIGPWRLEGALRQMLNAHTRTDPDSGTVYAFGPSFGPRHTLDVYALPRKGVPRLLASVPVPHVPVNVHDVALTRRHLVFLLHPLRVDLLRFLLGTRAPAEALRWKPEEGSEVVFVPLDGSAVTRFTMDGFFHNHYANAWEDNDGSCYVDLCRGDPSPEFWLSHSVARLRSGEAGESFGPMYLERLRIDPRRERVDSWRIAGLTCEFPVTAPAVQGRRHRFVYVLGSSAGRDLIARVDVQSGDVIESDVGELRFPGEPTYVARSAEEGDGWILTLVYDARAHRSGVAVLDGTALGDGPIGHAWFDHHAPQPLHGTWLPAPGA